MDLLKFCLNNTTDPSLIFNVFSKYEVIFIFLIIGISLIIEFFIMFKSDCVDEMRGSKFKKYMHVHSSGYGLRNIDMNKEYIILTSDFFDNISEHGKRYKCNLTDCRERFLIDYGYRYNIIIYADCGAYSRKYNKIIEYCYYKNYPVCRVIDFMPRGGFIEERITLNDGDKIYYFKLDEG